VIQLAVLVLSARDYHLSKNSLGYLPKSGPFFKVKHEVPVGIKFNRKLPARTLATIAFVLCLLIARATSGKTAADAALPAALCQVVYPLDQTPEEGYRYMFFGNGFFVNDEGYLITPAHLLSYFRNGGEPYILVGPPEGPRRMLQAPIVTADWDHDVAVLRATPNPFQSEKKIAYLPLSTETPVRGNGVLSASLRPTDVENAHSLAAPLQDFSRGEVIDYQFYRESATGESELLLFNQQVLPGQSGSPLVSAETQGVVGIVVGRWLRPTVIPSGANGGHLTLSPGAALRIHYAIGLLEQLHITWHTVSESSGQAATSAQQPKGFSAPVPLSLVATPYPPQALFGGEVVLDALIDSSGKLADVRVVTGDPPFLDTVLSAVHTWSFLPARMDGRAVEARIGIVFQFPQSFLPRVTSRERKYEESLANSADRAALPVVTVEPDYPTTSIAAGSVILYDLVDSQGQITSTSILRNVESLTAPAVAASHQWQFAPGKQAGAKTDSAVVVVVTVRRPTL
jgi:outer membrane biosynthesis protein TonB